MLKWKVRSPCCWGMKRAYCSFKPHSIVSAAVKYFWKFTAVGEIPWSLSVSSLPIRGLMALGFGLQKWHFSVTRLKLRRGFERASWQVWNSGEMIFWCQATQSGKGCTPHSLLCLCQNPKYRFKKGTRNMAQDSGLRVHFKQELSLIFNGWTALPAIRIPYKRGSMLEQIT